MAYSAISSSELNPDSPIVDTLFSRMRDNWIAIKNGESGAPRIRTQAIQPPSNGYNWAWQFFGSANTSSTEWVAVGPLLFQEAINGWGVQSPGGMQIWRTGNYNFWISTERTNTSHSSSVAVYRNGERISAIYTCPAGTSYRLFVFSLQLNAGDNIAIMANSDDLCTVGVLAGMTSRPFSYIG